MFVIQIILVIFFATIIIVSLYSIITNYLKKRALEQAEEKRQLNKSYSLYEFDKLVNNLNIKQAENPVIIIKENNSGNTDESASSSHHHQSDTHQHNTGTEPLDLQAKILSDAILNRKHNEH